MGHYNVNPRYTSGSPAMVDQQTADRVASYEKDAYAGALEGLVGEDERERAKRDGLAPVRDENGHLRAIAEWVEEKRDHFEVLCLVTDKLFKRPFAGDSEKNIAAREKHNAELNAAQKTLNALGLTPPLLIDFLIERVYRLENPDDKEPTPRKLVAWLEHVGQDLVLKPRRS